MKNPEENKHISRREFLKDAGLIMGGAALTSAAALSACSPKTVTQTVTQTQTVTSKAMVTTTALAQVTTDPTIKILNPEGQIAPVKLVPLAPRITGGFDGKTIYIVSVNFTATSQFLEELAKVFKEKYPNSNPVFKIKAGSYAASDQKLWDEVKEKAQGYVMAIGH